MKISAISTPTYHVVKGKDLKRHATKARLVLIIKNSLKNGHFSIFLVSFICYNFVIFL